MSAQPWWQGRLASFDTETTGVDVFTDRIVTACVALVGGGQPTEIRKWLIDPGVPIPKGASAIHGITDEKAQAEGQLPGVALEEIADELARAVVAGFPIIAVNASYDLTILASELVRHGLNKPIGPARVIDPLVLDRRVAPFRKGKRNLTALCEHYRCRIDGAHDSAHDALAGARVAYRIGSTHATTIGSMGLDELHEAQVGWFAQQAAGLEKHFRKTKPRRRGLARVAAAEGRVKPRANRAAQAAARMAEGREDAGRCVHCAKGTAWGLVDHLGKQLALCASCAGAARRTGKLPDLGAGTQP